MSACNLQGGLEDGEVSTGLLVPSRNVENPQQNTWLDSEADYQDSELLMNDPKKREEAIAKLLSFRDVKGFKQITDIHEHYRFYRQLGKGSFGEVLLGEHIHARVQCAIKVIRKKSIEKHDILVNLMHNELRVLE
jgi:hypothetical protein